MSLEWMPASVLAEKEKPEGPARIAFVDDDSMVLDALGRLLRHEPYEIFLTTDPREVIHHVVIWEVGLVIADLRLPEMRGTDLLAKVHALSPDTSCAIMTAYPEMLTASGGPPSWLRMTLVKPWRGSMLKRTIRRLLGMPEGDERW